MALRSVIIGAGFMGRRHIASVKNAESYELCGISDLNPEALALAVKEGIDERFCFTNTEQMLEEIKPDFALISTTAPSHYPLAKLAVEKGVKLLLVEKPFCVSIQQAVALRELCAKAGVRLAVNHGIRFDRHYMHAREIALREELGPITSVTLVGGNMGLAMNISHQLELFRLMTGQPISTVRAWLMDDPCPNPRGIQFHDGAGRVMAENAAGQRFYADVSPDQYHGLHMLITTRYAQIDIDFFTRKTIINRRREDQLANPSSRYGSPFVCEECELTAPFDTHVRTLEALAAGENYPDGEMGERIVRTLVAMWVSHENDHAPVNVDGPLPEDRVFSWA